MADLIELSFKDMARANGWVITLNHRDEYVAHDDTLDEENPDYILDAEDEDEAWEELCGLEGISREGFGKTHQLVDGKWVEI